MIADLKDGFKEAGDVERADVTGTTGTVLYANAADAAWAVQNYDNTNFHGSVVKVKFDAYAGKGKGDRGGRGSKGGGRGGRGGRGGGRKGGKGKGFKTSGLS